MKKQNKLILHKYQIEMLQKAYPNQCFCDKPTYTEKDYLDETPKEYYSIYDYQKNNPSSRRIFKCNTCGKEYIELLSEG